MRRARIKAVANVPLRRKATQDTPTPSQEHEEKAAAPAPATPPVSEDVKPMKIEILEQPKPPEKPEEQTVAPPPAEEIDNTENTENTESTRLPPIAIPQSPDNSFAVLGSPPYRAESFKSDSMSIKSPSSPSKLLQNRSRFVRPVPRLDGSGRIRRNSIQGSGASASESEDDGRRSSSAVPGRIRNDSVCSVQSNKEPEKTTVGQSKAPESRPVPKRRMVISESARKLAEARREFQQKHGNKAPDRNKLTMYDLIYYNPVTNPMKSQDEAAAAVARRDSVASLNDNLGEDEENADEPTAMPVPQVKVGPDGQLIIDEQSLVIEQTGTKKGREALANSQVVVDEGRTGNGFYKRPRKTKDWPKWETLRFYTALNTIGTDFLLMQSLFPNRSRQEIKLKFKKEEKTNRPLVEKALKYHQEFDTDALEEELAIYEEREKLEQEEKIKAKENKMKEKEKSRRKKRKRCGFVTLSIEQIDDSAEDDEDEVDDPGTVPEVEDPGTVPEEPSQSETNNNFSVEKPKKGEKRKHKDHKGSMDKALDDLVHGARIFTDSDSDTEIYEVKPTRSGRCPKTRKLQAPDINKFDEPNTDENSREEINPKLENPKLEPAEKSDESWMDSSNNETRMMEDPPTTVKNTIPDMSKVKPGSLVILSSESPGEPGKTMLQVYMVSPSPNAEGIDGGGQKKMTPIVDLSPELLATVTTKISDVEAPNVDGQQSVNTA